MGNKLEQCCCCTQQESEALRDALGVDIEGQINSGYIL